MGALANVGQEFKNAPPAGKALAIVAVLFVAGLGLYVARMNKNASSSSTTTNGNLLPIDLSGGSGSVDPPFPNFPASGGTTPTPTPTPSPVVTPVTPKPVPKPVPVAGGHPVSGSPVPMRYVWTTWWGNPGHPTGSPFSTLSGIAQHFYGNPNEWTKIYAANRNAIGNNPNLIKPGMRLVVPY